MRARSNASVTPRAMKVALYGKIPAEDPPMTHRSIESATTSRSPRRTMTDGNRPRRRQMKGRFFDLAPMRTSHLLVMTDRWPLANYVRGV